MPDVGTDPPARPATVPGGRFRMEPTIGGLQPSKQCWHAPVTGDPMRYPMATLPILALAVPALLAAPGADELRQCSVRQELERELDAADLEGVLVEAASGSLEIAGSDTDGIRVTGVLCASDEQMAAESRLVVERRRNAAWIQADLPSGGGWGGDYARMDLTISMPRGLAADIEDGSGEIRVRSIAAAHIKDGSGAIEVEDIAGLVRIDDGSGDIEVRRVGSVEVEDGSGGMLITDVQGSVVVLDDGSGEIEIRTVAGDVRIREDGSGSIAVIGVGGDFALEDDGSGSVRYEDIEGRVSLPPGR